MPYPVVTKVIRTWRDGGKFITQAEYDEIVRTGMHKGKPMALPQQCPECKAFMSVNTKPHNKRPDKTDRRCYNCREVKEATARLQAALRRRRIEREAARLLSAKQTLQRYTKARYAKRRREKGS